PDKIAFVQKKQLLVATTIREKQEEAFKRLQRMHNVTRIAIDENQPSSSTAQPASSDAKVEQPDRPPGSPSSLPTIVLPDQQPETSSSGSAVLLLCAY
ncbi:unnamed protein product, partial [Nippostrongylus brasiliensis]|uniref:Microphthalmia-associated transcription factor n=1 Tax=Nippostrongylus brasiliensis TaxID=27835 RepID=A0A0N4YZV5_NIPBR